MLNTLERVSTDQTVLSGRLELTQVITLFWLRLTCTYINVHLSAMKLLAICDPSRYSRPPLDVPTFYQHASLHPAIDFFHIPVKNVLEQSPHSTRVKVAPVSGGLDYDTFLELGANADESHDLGAFDLIFCRTLKPFPQNYLKQLQRWEKQTQFVNSPTGIEAQIEPEFLAQVASAFTPDMIVTQNWAEALAFFERHHTIVAKQFNSCGGRGVFKIWWGNNRFKVDNFILGLQEFTDFSQVFAYLQGATHKPLQFVRYLTRVGAGDKRVVVVNGEIYGAYLRRSKSGHWINNVSSDGECFLAEVTEAEREAVEGTVEQYRCRGLMTLGYDFLQDEEGTWRISEINAGNIGGFARLELLTGEPVMDRFLAWLIEFNQATCHTAVA